jgi:hypothetical protein
MYSSLGLCYGEGSTEREARPCTSRHLPRPRVNRIAPPPSRAGLDEMHRVVPWANWVAVSEPVSPKGEGPGRPPVGVERMLRLHCLPQGFTLSEPTQPFGGQIFFQISLQLPIRAVFHELHEQTAKEPLHAIPISAFELTHVGQGFGAIRQIGLKPPVRVRGRDQAVEIDHFHLGHTGLQSGHEV